MLKVVCLTCLILDITFLTANGLTINTISSFWDNPEGFHWDGQANKLFFVDLFKGGVYYYDHITQGSYNIVNLNGAATVVIPVKNNRHALVVSNNRSVVAIYLREDYSLQRLQNLTTVSPQFPKSFFNDGKVDSKGRLWLGTMGPISNGTVSSNQGILYTFTKNNLKNPSVADAPVNISNGLAWNKANNKFYYIDSLSYKVVEFEYNDKNGTISRKNRTVLDLIAKNITGLPDGMTIDTEDNLYVCLYGGGAVLKVNPKDGNVSKVIKMPTKFITSVTFGGPNLDILYVGSAQKNAANNERDNHFLAGSIFAVTGLGARGFPAHKVDII